MIHLLPYPLVLLAYSFIGSGLKYVDEAFDSDTFNKKISIVVAFLTAILFLILVLFDMFSATILLAIVAGVIIKGKIDNISFILGVVVIIMGILLCHFLIHPIQILFIPFLFFTAAGVLDETGNDIVDASHKKHSVAHYFFSRRYLLKVAVLYTVLLGVIPWYYLIATILFDELYIIIGIISNSKLK